MQAAKPEVPHIYLTKKLHVEFLKPPTGLKKKGAEENHRRGNAPINQRK